MENSQNFALKIKNLKNQINQLLRKKDKIRNEINTFQKEFESKEGKKPEKEDKEPVKHLYNEYSAINRQVGQLKNKLEIL
jgi:uncharacterized coiled-coil DUF342 family protein